MPSPSSDPTRRPRRIGVSSFFRLMVLTVVALGATVLYWPYGIGLLLGLAIFRLIALVMTTLIYLAFDRLLTLSLPAGPLERLL